MHPTTTATTVSLEVDTHPLNPSSDVVILRVFVPSAHYGLECADTNIVSG